jgi:uncharacterized membrane protein YbhN (UPF0104 family)
VVIAPAGLGAREAVLVALLAPVVDRAGATAASLVARLLMTAGDVVLAGAAALAWRAAKASGGTELPLEETTSR